MESKRGKFTLVKVVVVAFVVATALFAVKWARDGADDRPNVLIIVLDTARGDRFSCMGYDRPTSPNIDALARQGVLFSRAFTTDFWTLPAHASLFTGLYPGQAGATAETNHLPDSNLTLAEMLQEVGYRTVAFVCNPWVSRERGFGQGFGDFHEMWRKGNMAKVVVSRKPLDTITSERVLGWLDQYGEDGEPFFIFVNLNCVHMPYRPPNRFLSRFLRPPHNVEQIKRLSQITEMWAHLAGAIKLSEDDYRVMSDLYDGEVALADECVGQIVDRLRAMGQLDNTLVIVTSDHGENIGDHGMIDHILSMYDSTLSIPLIIRYPERFEANKTIDDLVSLVDIAPTVLDVCRVREVPEEIDVSKTSLCSESRVRRAFVVAENERPINGLAVLKTRFPAFDRSSIDYRMRSLRTGNHKLIWQIDGDIELYDLRADPGELVNLAETDVTVRDQMHSLLQKWMSQIRSANDLSLFESNDAESMEVLRSLGYVK